MSNKVMLGMSGGVDSSVAALLLLKAGYDVTGVTMRLRPDAYMQQCAAGGCCSLDDIDDARRVCYQLGIDHLVLNFTDRFEKDVIQYFADQYAAGRTPNPCIACNRHLKFDAMLQKARLLGFDSIATGHYAVIEQNAQGRWLLRKAPASKDQSYVLYSMTQDQLAHTLMPLGAYTKPEARKMAEEAGLQVAHKPDSQEICFVEDNDYAGFLERFTGEKAPAGDFVDQDGNVLGKHLGITYYTIGQRKGLGIAFGRPMYVTHIDAEHNRITLGEEGSQYADTLVAEDLNFIPFDVLGEPLRAQVKVRYQAKPAPALLSPMENGRVRVTFDEAQRSVTPGQAVVFYDGDLVLGGGTIVD
ncbi:tRNA 2-thiouridine(34) synthase MnmA [Anaeromassilibacillus senegalensis]|uniref:tRNA 2-thiouridine(34) synthase MnmA n=1 Tax=Anaeromassilibacillus senegalensis TaxID=1673717 RepID=UPI000680794E|nr:tRNA 2-thiouridine(34) synthase MnmA [Anaeromassilibacillus senegalensis]